MGTFYKAAAPIIPTIKILALFFPSTFDRCMLTAYVTPKIIFGYISHGVGFNSQKKQVYLSNWLKEAKQLFFCCVLFAVHYSSYILRSWI